MKGGWRVSLILVGLVQEAMKSYLHSLLSCVSQIVSSVYCLSVLMSLISLCIAQVTVGIGSVAFVLSWLTSFLETVVGSSQQGPYKKTTATPTKTSLKT